jgi:riboflavin kinase/FMN adenylyltransferase
LIVVRRARDIPGGGATVVTIGVFDGVHRGHRAVLEALRAEAVRADAGTLVVTLDPHPREVLRPGSGPELLTTPDERCALFEEVAGPIDAALVQTFDREVAALSPAEFLERIVPPGARLAGLVLGYDFRMGRGRSGGYDELLELGARRGFTVRRVDPSRGNGDPVSSSRIRELVRAGDAAGATLQLGHPYRIAGTVVEGRGMGRTLGFPTANVAIPDPRKLRPGLGVYAVRVRLAGEASSRHGVMNYGTRPTFGSGDPVLEVHVLDFEADLLGRVLAVDLVDRLRGEEKFDGPSALVAAIARDVENARKILRVRN